jgi:hypothetical protein
MPFTPFHFGPGAALAAIAPRHVSFIAFCAANVVIDVETLYNIVYGREPLHAFFHTYIGATIAAAATVPLVLAVRAFARRWRWSNLFGVADLTLRQIVLGVLAGAWSHVVLDGIMHSDSSPLAPWRTANALYGVIDVPVLHGLCTVAGIVGLAIFLWRDARRDA